MWRCSSRRFSSLSARLFVILRFLFAAGFYRDSHQPFACPLYGYKGRKASKLRPAAAPLDAAHRWMRPTDPSGRAVDERVVAACNRLWRWAYFHVEAKLHDAPSAAELMEEVALDVSRRLQAEPAVERNLTGYVITAFHRRYGHRCSETTG